MDDLGTTVKKSRIPRFARKAVTFIEVAAALFLGDVALSQNTLTVQAYNQQGSTLSGAQVKLETPQGTLRGTTNSSGIATFEDVQGTSTVTIAGSGKIGASQSVAIDASKTFNGVIIDGAGITAQILRNTNGVDPIYEKNPILFDITSPNPVIPVDASALGTVDSTTVMGYVAQMNGSWNIFVPGKVELGVSRGIILKISDSYGTNPLPQGEDLLNC
jgi:hypothetical protein